MAVNESRSMNAELREGITDGWIKKIAPNRGGDRKDFAESAMMMNNLSNELYDTAKWQLDELADRITS